MAVRFGTWGLQLRVLVLRPRGVLVQAFGFSFQPFVFLGGCQETVFLTARQGC